MAKILKKSYMAIYILKNKVNGKHVVLGVYDKKNLPLDL
jgi:hypothetical protein